MDFKRISIPYAGREKYPSNGTGASIRSMITNLFGGSGAGGGIPGGGGDNRGGNASASFCFLSKTSGVYSAIDLAQSSITDNIQVMGYKNNDQAQTFIGDISQASPTTNYGILGVPASGMSILVSNNGTTGTTIILTIDSTISEDSGTLTIPVAINLSDNNLDPYHEVWYQNSNNCNVLYLQFSWTINRAATGNYTMDLSNQTAGVNCDTAGTLYSNSIATLQCTATTYYNGAVATGITYSVRTQAAYAAFGYSINANTGAMSFTSAGTGQFYWAPAYPSLPIDIIAIKDGQAIATKTMTITRNYPGSDGTPAHTRYILTDADFVVYDPNTSAFTPTQVTGQVWIQIGNELPTRDTGTTIYQWYDNLEQYKTSAQGSITAQTHDGISSIFFALRNDQNEYYEIEEVPVITKGKDGEPGSPGTPGASGESAWYMTLSNDNASINCDSEGNILSGAIRPTCQAKLYHGNARQTSVTYNVDLGGASGVTTSTTNGILTLTFGSSFNFTGSVLNITISGSTESTLRDVKIMNVTKSYAGENGDDAISYWIEVNYGEILYDPNTHSVSPTQITAAKYKQVGSQAAVVASDATLKYRWQSRSTGSFGSETTYSSAINIASGHCTSYSRLRFTLYVGSAQVDQEDVDILMNGTNGEPGESRPGPAIRGPYNWDDHSGSTRCWCAGETGGTCSDCDKWIDVIVKDGVYYYCNTTYYGSLSPWNNVKSYWTSGDTFDFIATNLLLASSASINFLTNNALYLRDGDGNITGGAKGGTGTTFWAGAENPDDPADPAPFRVDVEGNIYAQKGIFAGYIQYPYTFVNNLMPNLEVSASTVSRRYLSSTTWKGKLASAPANPSNGWCYANTTEQKIYYYSSGWKQMTETGNQDGYLADGHAYLVSDNNNQSSGIGSPATFYLPAPSSDLNGFTYDIIVEPRISRMDGSSQLDTKALDGSDIYCYAFAELRVSDNFILENGRFTITCMPRRNNNTVVYRWAITTVTGSLTDVNTYESLSTLLATAYDANPLYKVVTYTGSTKPSVPNQNQTMFVKQ